MELKLKHITPYLPYGLKFVFTEEHYYPYPTKQKAGFIFTFDLTETPQIIYCSNINRLWLDVILNQYYFKPILRPLSDLAKEIEINGEKFVPILELAKVAYPRRKPFEDFNIFDDYVKLDKWNVQGYSFHFDKSDTSFDCRVDYDGKKWRSNCFVPNQLDLFQKLFEWHFDVFGLIPLDLAIDINT